MEHLKKNFGFGFMRLPMKDGEIDLAETSKMVDAFLDVGGHTNVFFKKVDNLSLLMYNEDSDEK